MTIARVPAGTASALTAGQREALENFYGALGSHQVDLVDQALASDWEDIPLLLGRAPVRRASSQSSGCCCPRFRIFRTRSSMFSLRLTGPLRGAGQEPCKPQSTALREQGAHHSPSILSTKRQRSILMFANQSSGERRLLVTPPITLPAAFAGESADLSPVGLWSELGRSRWSLPEHTIRISSLCPF
jgi:hypothetical protein